MDPSLRWDDGLVVTASSQSSVRRSSKAVAAAAAPASAGIDGRRRMHRASTRTKKPGIRRASRVLLLRPLQPPGLKPIVRRVVVADATGWKRQLRTALSAARSNTRGGLARTTRGLLTEPSGLTVNSTTTSPESPERSAAGG